MWRDRFPSMSRGQQRHQLGPPLWAPLRAAATYRGPELPSRPTQTPGNLPRGAAIRDVLRAGPAEGPGPVVGTGCRFQGSLGGPMPGHLQRLLCLPLGERRPTTPLCPLPDEAAHPSVSGASRLQCQPWDLSPHLCLEGSNGCRECSLAARCVPSWQSGRRVSRRLCHQSRGSLDTPGTPTQTREWAERVVCELRGSWVHGSQGIREGFLKEALLSRAHRLGRCAPAEMGRSRWAGWGLQQGLGFGGSSTWPHFLVVTLITCLFSKILPLYCFLTSCFPVTPHHDILPSDCFLKHSFLKC